MGNEIKQTMKFMWGHSEKHRWSCGCSLVIWIFYCFFAIGFECKYFADRNVQQETVMTLYSLGVYSSLWFLLGAMYTNNFFVSSSTGKWVKSSPLVKSVLTKGIMINKVLLYMLIFIPSLFMRIRLFCLGYTAHARIPLFLIVWGLVYLLAVLSELVRGLIYGVAMVFLLMMFFPFMPKQWSLPEGMQLSTGGAVVVFLVCMIGGTLLEKVILEYSFHKRTIQKKIESVGGEYEESR